MAGCTPASSPAVSPPVPVQTVVTLPSSTARSTSTASPELRLDSIINFRDVAGSGAGLAITGGGHMARGVVFRSGKLQQLSAADRVALIKAGVSDIFDLRTVAVAKRSPDPAVGRAKYHLINVFGVYETDDPVAKTPSAARRERQQMNRRFVTDPKQRERIGSLMRGIADARGAVVIHCTEGKDRTGWVSAILQMVAGVGDEQVMDEYLLSNRRRAQLIEQGIAKARKTGGSMASDVARIRLTVDDDYLKAGLDELEARYGDLNGYLKVGLGLDQETIVRLQLKLQSGA